MIYDTHVVLVTGPTASGKSRWAMEWALEQGAEIINADSMQLYSHLPILTACPSPEDYDHLPHHLYGVLEGQQQGSVGWWVQACHRAIEGVRGRGNIPCVVGGTGLYLHGLTHGLSPIPEIPKEIRERIRQEAQLYGIDSFYEHVCQQDPLVRDKLQPHDLQRLTRALEVMTATNRSFFEWQGEPRQKSSYSFQRYILAPERSVLYDRINRRFLQMIEQGAIEEVKTLYQDADLLSSSSPILRAVGVKEIGAYLRDDLSKDEMIERSQQATRHYAKRQMTWLRTQSKQDLIPTALVSLS